MSETCTNDKDDGGENVIPLVKWFRYSPLQSVIVTDIDIAQPASANHG
jgi:hypothetical protein